MRLCARIHGFASNCAPEAAGVRPLSPVIHPNQCAMLIAHLQPGLAGQLPLVRAAQAGHVRWIAHIRGTRVSPSLLESGEPTIIVIGDDDGAATGPAGWPQADRLLGWSASALLHGAGAEAEHYALAVMMAGLGRHLLVETASTFLEGWRHCARRAGVPALAIRPSSGSAQRTTNGQARGRAK